MINDQILKNRARVLDTDLAGRASSAGADELLAEVVRLERVPARRRVLPSPRRALLGLAAASVLAGGFVVVPSFFSGAEQVYASQAVTIDRDGDSFVFYITDGDLDPAELEKAFRKVGLDNLTVGLIPVSPRQREPVVGFDKTDPDAVMGSTTGDCRVRVEGCLTAFRVTADIEGPAEFRLGRPARPGERYAYPADAGWPGEALAGIRLRGRSVAEAVEVVREHHLKVAYGLDWPIRNGEVGIRTEQDVPASRIDPGWQVTAAETYNDGVITLRVAPGDGATPPPGF
ncbi:hypothetical protein Sru01_29240 [Sphaerisporangium rufum]|uniref:Uncharacterized protein n=1 Tax=Sphaerisporangium rufum TaxID=1381558 RepID=A0A919R1H4_9ACTN|nr:hypothetical protein [Sphaerisporangium rufum]GII77942.1 hypothetical protein Sru01_29240 [Sphaerisporangium rufum]